MATGTRPFREGMRQQMREAVLDATRDLIVARGWANVRMEDIASAAGVSRRTVYNEFANRDGLAEAVVEREVGVFLAGIRAVLDAHPGDLRGAVEGAVSFALTAARENPLVEAVLTSARGSSESLLPYLTTDAGMVLKGSTELVQEYARRDLPWVDSEDVAVGAEALARVVVSNIVLPLAPVEKVAADLADLAVRFVATAEARDPTGSAVDAP